MVTRNLHYRINRSVLLSALILATSAILGAQQPAAPDPYRGVSTPPPNDTITNDVQPAPAPQPKPSPSVPANIQPAQPAPPQYQTQAAVQPALPPPAAVDTASGNPADGTDDGIVQVAPDPTSISARPALDQRNPANDPDGDIVHPSPLGPNELGEGATIRVRLLQRLSTTEAQDGEPFRSRVASDVLQDGQVLIPAGAEIDGKVSSVSTGTLGGHGSMHLNPDTVILPDGSRFRLYAQVTSTPGSHTRVGSEGEINPDSHLKKDAIEYGGVVGAGAVTGAVIGGPAGALAGTLIGAGLVTVHLLVNHPQANLEEGTALVFTLTQNLRLVPDAPAGN